MRWFRVTRGERQRTCLAAECRAELRRRWQREAHRKRYASDPRARQAGRERARRHYERNRAAVLARQAERFRERYATDPDFREQVKRRARDAYRRRIEKDTNHNAARRRKDNEK
jgi:hypothetical protein